MSLLEAATAAIVVARGSGEGSSSLGEEVGRLRFFESTFGIICALLDDYVGARWGRVLLFHGTVIVCF